MSADRMRKEHDLFTLRDWGHLEKDTWRRLHFGGVDRLHWLSAFLFLEWPFQKAFTNSSAWWWGPQRGRMKWVLLLQSHCPPLLLDCSYSQSNSQLASWFVADCHVLPVSFTLAWHFLGLPSRNRTEQGTAPYEPPGLRQRHNCPPVWVTPGCGISWGSAGSESSGRQREREIQCAFLGFPTPLS